jgi:hypothetical protein
MVFIFAHASFSSRLVTNCSSSSCVGFQGQIEAAMKEQGGKGEVREAGRQQSWALMINAFNHDWALQINSKLISPGLQALSFFLSLRQIAHSDHDQKSRRGGSRRRGSTTLAVGRLSTRSIIEICDSSVRILPSKGKLKGAAALRSGLSRQPYPCACCSQQDACIQQVEAEWRIAKLDCANFAGFTERCNVATRCSVCNWV